MNFSSPNTGPIKSSEPTHWRWLFIFIVVVIALATFPYLYAVLIAPAGTFFTGTHALSPADFPVYFSYIEQVAQGQTMFRDLFTPLPHAPFIFSPFWYGVGLLSRLPGVSALGAFHIARLLLIPAFFLVLERWLRSFFPAWRDRKLGLILVTFGSGFGAFIAPLAIAFKNGVETFWPIDLWVSEAFTFLTLYQTPHFIAATILLLLVFYWFSEGIKTDNTRYYLGSGLALGALMSFHPFHLPTVATVLIMQVVFIWYVDRRVPWGAIKGGLIVLFIAGPMILYQGLVYLWNPIAAGRAAQNVNHTPTWWVVLLSYGLMVPLALAGLSRKLKYKSPDRTWWLLAVWLIGQYLVFTIPSTFNRRMTQGWLLPLAVFSVVGIRYAFQRYPKLKQVPRSALFGAFILFMSFSPLVVIGQDFAYFSKEQYRRFPFFFYISNSYKSVAEWLKNNSNPTDVVLAGQIGSLYVPALAARPVVFGHTVESVGFWEKRAAFREAFLDDPSVSAAQAYFKRWDVKYLLWGGEETAEYKLSPDEIPGLIMVYSSPPLILYQVR